MSDFISTFQEKQYEWLIALVEHLQISALAIIIAIVISVPLGIVLSNSKKIKEAMLQVTGIFQTIPSLALLGLFIPFMGIGKVPAVTALVIYAIFPIFQSTVTGLAEIDPSIEEAATAFGMTRWEKITKFQFALAMPIMMSGIRTASVLVIGTATLAALVGAGGLGSFILLGIDRNNSSLILIGAISSALLAILFSLILNFFKHKSPRTNFLALLLVSVLLVVSVLPSSHNPMNRLVVAGKLGAEPEILINMYKLLIEDETDINVEVKPNFGKTNFLYGALKGGSIDVYTEYSGTIIQSLLSTPEKMLSNDPETVYELARDRIYQQDNLVFLRPTAFQDTYALAVKPEFAKAHNLKNISDLANVGQPIRAAFSLEFNDRPDGNKGLKSLYGLNLDVAITDPALRYQAIANDQVDLIEVYSTDSQLITQNLQLLNDDKFLFPPYQAAPLLRQDTLDKYPQIEPILNKLANQITTEEMTEMNYQVDVEQQPAAKVAREYLERKKLL